MKELSIKIAVFISEHLIFFYAIAISLVNLLLAIVSIRETRKYIRNNRHVDDQAVLSSPSAPSISLLVPMYNEEKSIIDSVRSLLSLQYNNYDVIVINDGSTDNSLGNLIDYFQLIPLAQQTSGLLPTRKILGVYKSKNRAFGKLILIDKLNGGKADALNAGLNISENKLVATMDADSIIAPDALLKMVRPFLRNKTRVIATGAIVRVANSCKVEDGSLVNVQLPSNLLARFQTLEYLRIFLLSRIAWSKLNGLLIVSGAFGLFDKQIAIKAGGYSINTVGEDMELVVRMRRYMHKLKQKYKVFYIPDPLCWTEAPSEIRVLERQRNRWARGAAETLYRHRQICLNPRYGLMGMLSYPYWFLFEYLAPYIEIIGVLYFIGLLIWGAVNWTYFFALLGLVYAFAVFISVLALLAEEFSFHKYSKRSDTAKLALTALLEPILYHPIVLFSVLKGHLDLLFGKKSWGNMKRTGFKNVSSEKPPRVTA
ncbi:biofilm PGA synthesis N-glycosyltransferase PgaC [Catalinimonas alkaloidigena]|uniref:glycosyltransferase family 2 protein n=1 Tax=Catalinimonas alkaloidigena TaxID=1075417 RepID=UPI00240581A3|nr:glycosyltransferase [Catalinimonas alkaloidigena]MDF9800397.1 biofilm PGA synthesis N-glycosyltransferase PgaC [Catalinimonas alkaloidigena]